MRGRYGQSFLVALLVFVMVGVPQIAKAQASGDCSGTPYWQQAANAQGGNFSTTACGQWMANQRMAVAQQKTAAYNGVMNSVPPISVNSQYGMGCITSMFGSLKVSNPMDILMGIANKMIQQLEQQACQMAKQTITQMTGAITSQINNSLCIPVPKLPSLTGGFKIPQAKACGGIPIFQATAGVTGGTVPSPLQMYQSQMFQNMMKSGGTAP